jgi:colanic acid biosynthesis glycosyl transferase WcaI
MRARIVAKGVPAGDVVLFADWADSRLFELTADHAAAREIRHELKLGDGFLVVHAGNMGVKQGLDVVIDAALRTRVDPSIRYVLVGDGAMRPHLEQRARSEALTNVVFVPLLEHERFLTLLATADVALITQQRTVADVVFPSKALTLLAAGKPVVASVTDASAVAAALVQSGAGVVVAAEDPGALTAAIKLLQHDHPRRLRMSAAGRTYAAAQWERTRTLAYLADTVSRVAAPRLLDTLDDAKPTRLSV